MAATPDGLELARQAYKITMIFAAIYIAAVVLFVL